MAERAAIRRGQLHWVDWSPARGSEPAGRRPALVVQHDAGNLSPTYPNTIVVAVSRQGREVPQHVRLRASARTGLRVTSFAKCEQMMTISKDRLSPSPIGRLDTRDMGEVDLALAMSLGLPIPE